MVRRVTWENWPNANSGVGGSRARLPRSLPRLRKRAVEVDTDVLPFLEKSERHVAYSEKVIDHAENPRNVGTLDKEDPNAWGPDSWSAPACGDVMRLQIRGERRRRHRGCEVQDLWLRGSAIASSSLATEWIKGKSVDDAEDHQELPDIVTELNLPPVKIHCSVLAEARDRRGAPSPTTVEGSRPTTGAQPRRSDLESRSDRRRRANGKRTQSPSTSAPRTDALRRPRRRSRRSTCR